METIDNILREMRKDMPRVVDAKVILRNYADRIEAARKHETVKDCHALNAAKMREAAKATMKVIESAIVNGKISVEALSTLQNITSRALSAPHRNCDRFADGLDAQIGFLNDVWLISVDKDTVLERDKFENWTEEMKSTYSKWLFDKAKGGEKDD